MTSQPPILNLPVPLLSAILSLVPSEGSTGFAAALESCTALRRAGELHLSDLPLHLRGAKLRQCREAGRQWELLAFVRRAGYFWRAIVIEADNRQDVEVLLRNLKPGHLANEGLGMCELTVKYTEGRGSSPAGIPEVLTTFSALSALTLRQGRIRGPLPPERLAQFSALTALQSLTVDAAFAAIPPAAISRLQRLTSLVLFQPDPNTVRLGEEHLNACTALRHLQLAGVVPTLSEQGARRSWQQLQRLSIQPASSCQDAGFWHALPSLASLTSLDITGFSAELLQRFSTHLPACTTLEQLILTGYSDTAVPQLPPSLTLLFVAESPGLLWLPSSPALRSLTLVNCPSLAEIPGQASAMVHLTSLQLVECNLRQLPAELAVLPAVEELNLRGNSTLSDLPGQLACLSSLRRLNLSGCALTQVPVGLGGGLGSSLEYLNLSRNTSLVLDDGGLAILSSLTALTWLMLQRISRVELNEGVDTLRACLPNCNVLD